MARLWVGFFWLVALVSFAHAELSRCPRKLAEYLGTSLLLFPGQASVFEVHIEGARVRVQFPHRTGEPPELQVRLNGRTLRGVGRGDAIRFETPSGIVDVPLDAWAQVLAARRVELLRQALKAGSRDRTGVLEAMTNPHSLAASFPAAGEEPGLAELVDDLFVERVVLPEILAELPNAPTLLAVVSKARDLVTQRVETQIRAVKERIGNSDRLFQESLDRALGQMRRHGNGAVKAVQKSSYANETFTYSHPRHAEFFDGVINGVYGEAGELMLAVRVPSLSARGVKVRKFPPSPEDLERAADAVRAEANLYFFEQQERERLFAKWGVSSSDGPAIGAAIQANLLEYQRAMESARGRGEAPDQAAAISLFVTKKFKTTFHRTESIEAAFQRLARQRASQYTVLRLKERLAEYFGSRVSADDLERTVQRYLDKEIDLIYADHAYWGEVKNYGEVMTPALLNRVFESHGRRSKSILEQARENVHLARALMGPAVRVYQLVPDGFTLEAALLLEKEGISVMPSSIIFPATPPR